MKNFWKPFWIQFVAVLILGAIASIPPMSTMVFAATAISASVVVFIAANYQVGDANKRDFGTSLVIAALAFLNFTMDAAIINIGLMLLFIFI